VPPESLVAQQHSSDPAGSGDAFNNPDRPLCNKDQDQTSVPLPVVEIGQEDGEDGYSPPHEDSTDGTAVWLSEQETSLQVCGEQNSALAPPLKGSGGSTEDGGLTTEENHDKNESSNATNFPASSVNDEHQHLSQQVQQLKEKLPDSFFEEDDEVSVIDEKKQEYSHISRSSPQNKDDAEDNAGEECSSDVGSTRESRVPSLNEDERVKSIEKMQVKRPPIIEQIRAAPAVSAAAQAAIAAAMAALAEGSGEEGGGEAEKDDISEKKKKKKKKKHRESSTSFDSIG